MEEVSKAEDTHKSGLTSQIEDLHKKLDALTGISEIKKGKDKTFKLPWKVRRQLKVLAKKNKTLVFLLTSNRTIEPLTTDIKNGLVKITDKIYQCDTPFIYMNGVSHWYILSVILTNPFLISVVKGSIVLFEVSKNTKVLFFLANTFNCLLTFHGNLNVLSFPFFISDIPVKASNFLCKSSIWLVNPDLWVSSALLTSSIFLLIWFNSSGSLFLIISSFFHISNKLTIFYASCCSCLFLNQPLCSFLASGFNIFFISCFIEVNNNLIKVPSLLMDDATVISPFDLK